MRRSNRLFKLAAGCAGGVLVACATVAGLFRGQTYHPADRQEIAVEGSGEASVLAPGTSLKVLVWNVQFCGTRKHHFFYDGGDTVHVPAEDVHEALGAIGDVIGQHQPHISLLQEIDRNSDRTGRLDQLDRLLAAQPHAGWAAAPYHKAGYVPHPPGKHLGRVDMELVTLAQRGMSSAVRHQLALLDEPFYRRAFNLKRAILETTFTRSSGPPFVVLNTHLSAFSYGDGTLEAQVQQIERRLEELDEAGSPWILGGDFNLLPPGDDPGRLGDDAGYYSDHNNPIEILFAAGRRSAFSPTALLEEESVGTYQPYGSDGPDRTLDYLFVSEEVEVQQARVLTDSPDISDHLPLLVEIVVP